MLKTKFALLSIAVTLLAGPAVADVLYSNPYDPVADTGDCSFSSTCGASVSQPDDFAAQAFTLANDSTVTSASFTELDGTQLSGPSSIAWAFYTNASGLPGSLIASGNASVASSSSAGVEAFGSRFVDTYTFDTSDVALAAGSYFFALHTTSADFYNFLAQGQIQSGAANSPDGGTTWTTPYVGVTGIAVEVDGTQAMPEPLSISLFGGGLALLGLVRRRRA